MDTERQKVREKGMIRNERLIEGMTKGRRKGKWETKSKRKTNDEVRNIDLRNDRWNKEKKLRDENKRKEMMRNKRLI